jgi:hypothetical protein
MGAKPRVSSAAEGILWRRRRSFSPRVSGRPLAECLAKPVQVRGGGLPRAELAPQALILFLL